MYSRIDERIAEFIRLEAEKLGYYIVALGTKSGKASFLEVVLDKKGGINLDECGDFNQRVRAWAEEQKIPAEAYLQLDVCSPGLDRELKTETEFLWAVGKQIKVSLRLPFDGKNVIEGKFVKLGDDGSMLIEEAGGGLITAEKNNIIRARLNMINMGEDK